MTEEEWKAFTGVGSVGWRKLYLTACACCRHRPLFIALAANLEAVEVVERLADNEEEWRMTRRGRIPFPAYPEGLTTRRAMLKLARASTYLDHTAAVPLLRDVQFTRCCPVLLNDTWRTPLIVSLATAAYEDRILPSGELALDRLAVLADALEDVGASKEITDHLRSEGPHVRGCWALDLALGKS
jgi:hypothetical protein